MLERVALLIAHATQCVILLPAASLAAPSFTTFSHKRRDFRNKVTERKIFFFGFLYKFTILSQIFLILRIIQVDIVINMRTYSCKVPLILVGF